ncbi:MAG: hypothetical protein IM674_09845 [Brevundimonas sp.]|nr:hypothetical protein [Brevundimonas sp.]
MQITPAMGQKMASIFRWARANGRSAEDAVALATGRAKAPDPTIVPATPAEMEAVQRIFDKRVRALRAEGKLGDHMRPRWQ